MFDCDNETQGEAENQGRSEGRYDISTRRQVIAASGLGLMGLLTGPSSAGDGSLRSSAVTRDGVTDDTASLSGQVTRIGGDSGRTRVALYTRDGDEATAVAETESDSDGRFTLPTPSTNRVKLIARAGDWFTTRALQTGEYGEDQSLTLDQQFLFGPETATEDLGPVVDIGTVTIWRRVSPSSPDEQVLFVDVTSPGMDAESDISVLSGASFALTLPEHVTVGYRQGTVTACRDDGRPPQCRRLPYEGTDLEAITAWHPSRGPGLPPFALAGNAYEATFDVERQNRRRVDRATNFLNSALLGLASGGLATLIGALQTVSPEQSPDATLGQSSLEQRSPNEYDTVAQPWVPPDGLMVHGLTYQVPIRLDPSRIDSDGVTATLLTRWKTRGLNNRNLLLPEAMKMIGESKNSFRLDIPNSRESTSEQPPTEQPTTPTDYVTKTGRSSRGDFSFTVPTTVARGEQFTIDGTITEAPTEQYGGFKVRINGEQVASEGLGAGQSKSVSLTHRFRATGRQRLTIEVRFKNSDFGIDERVGRVTFDVRVTDASGTADVDMSAARDWVQDTSNYTEFVDRTDQRSVEISVGAPGNGAPFAFDPPAVTVTSGTTVRWVWTGEGGVHNVVGRNGQFESPLQSEPGAQFTHEFDARGSYLYSCRPHESVGMKGAVVVV